jgi:hypothetical protein
MTKYIPDTILFALFAVVFGAGFIINNPTADAVSTAHLEFTSHISGCYRDNIKSECVALAAARSKLDAAVKADQAANPEAYKPY